MSEEALNVPRAPRAASPVEDERGASVLDARPERRYMLVKAAVAVGFASAFLLSFREWVSVRAFPLTPVWEGLVLPYPFDYALFWCALALLVPIALLRRSRPFLAAFIALAVVLALLDQQRWQPWFYQYLFMFGALAFYGGPDEERSGERLGGALNTCRVIVASLYVWSGIQKLNASFVENTWPWMTEPIVSLIPASQGFFDYMVYGAPFLEFCIGLGLLTLRFRNVAVLLALGLHAFIVACIGPWGLDFNSVVWPWNFVMPAAVVLLFWRTSGPTLRGVLSRTNLYGKVVVALFLVMPIFNFFGLWDSFLSASLYTGNTKRAAFYMDDRTRAMLPEAIRTHTEPLGEGMHELSLFDWAFTELNSPPFPEERLFRNVGRELCARTDNSPGLFMVVTGKLENPLRAEPPRTLYRCEDL